MPIVDRPYMRRESEPETSEPQVVYIYDDPIGAWDYIEVGLIAMLILALISWLAGWVIAVIVLACATAVALRR